MAREYGPPEPSTLGGSTLRLKITSTPNERRFLDVIVDDRQVGKGGEAHVYSIQPTGNSTASEYRALGIPLGTKLVARFSTRDTAVSARRVSALRSIIEIQRQRPESLLGLVTIYGFGIVDRIDGARVDGGLFFDLMVDAGDPLYGMVALNGEPGPGKRWVLTPGETAAAFIPAARALATLHGIKTSDDGSVVATAHRDIKPGNALVLWPEERAFASAIAGYSDEAVPPHALPLLRFGDLGDVRSVAVEPGATATRAPGSARWSAPEVYSGIVRNPAAADVWSFGATLFYAATGSYPWTRLEHADDFAVARFAIDTSTPPDSPGFATLPQAMEQLIRHSLRVDPEDRPSMSDIAVELERLVVAEHVFVEADTPTREVQVPLRPILYVNIPDRPKPKAPAEPKRTNDMDRMPAAWYLGIAAVAALALFVMVGFRLIPVENFPVDLRPIPSAAAQPKPSVSGTAAPTASTPPRSNPTITPAAATRPPSPPPDPVLGIGPWTVSTTLRALRQPLSNQGWAYKWAINSTSGRGSATNVGLGLSEVNGAGPLVSTPSYVLALTEIKNDSTKTMTFNLANCSPPATSDSITKSGSGPGLIVSGPVKNLPSGFSFNDGKGPFVAMPSCGSPAARWAGPITVKAKTTWRSANAADYTVVFNMPPGSTAASHKVVGFQLKSTDGDAAFGHTDDRFDMTLPAPASGCHC